MESDARIFLERSLRAAVLAGDSKAWEVWYDESFESLYRYALWRCGGNQERAEDLVQETWLVAVQNLANFDPERGPFLEWLRGIASNLIRNLARKQRSISLAGAEPARADEGCDAVDRSELIEQALSCLPEQYEMVLRAKYLDERSVVEIAALRAETPKGVESLLTRARQAFRVHVERLGLADERVG